MVAEQVVDDTLLDIALAVSGLKTKQETINLALEEFVQKRKRLKAIEGFGTIDFDEDWSPRKVRGKI
ncbi:hypothetical protein FACS1894172_03430 [Spirochaetia bacterium]|nr:hypothetical protein FACS1894172_03430 [Spirochaetia bacterium]